MGFGFAQPLQRRLSINGPATPMQPAALPSGPGVSLDQIKAGMNRIGLSSPVPSPVGPIPTITSPAMPSGGGIEDPTAAITSAADKVADGMGVGGEAAAGAGDALAADSAGIGDFLAALFL